MDLRSMDVNAEFGNEWRRAQEAIGLKWTDITFMSLKHDSGVVHVKLPGAFGQWVGYDRRGTHLFPAVSSEEGIHKKEILNTALTRPSGHYTEMSDFDSTQKDDTTDTTGSGNESD